MAGSTDRPPGVLWTLLSEMRIEEPGAERSFETALAEENDWPLEKAVEVSREYRRFLYLAATAGPQLTPSSSVDKAWHLHLTYSRHYWDVMCGTILGRPLHHGPSAGGSAEEARYREQYEKTLVLYEATFGSPPPSSVWPRLCGDRRTEGSANERWQPGSTQAGCGVASACGGVEAGAGEGDASGGGGGCGGGCGGN